MPWYNASWTYRFKITSDQTKVDEAVDNVVYDLANAPAGFWSHVKSDGGDIRVTQSDGSTEVAREISGFSVGSTVGALFFAATGLSASVNTDYYVYYGNSGASEPAAGSTYGKNNVWGSHLAVFHLDESSGDVSDSKGGVTGTCTNITLASSGKVRTGANFTNFSARIAAGDNFDLTAASLTLSAWINPSNVDETKVIVAKVSGSPGTGYSFYHNLNGGLELGIGDGSAEDFADSTASVITASAYQLVHVTYDGSNARFYVNGAAQGAPALTRVPGNTAGTFTLGNYSDTDFNYFRTGTMDEVRVSTSVRSANWISTEFNN